MKKIVMMGMPGSGKSTVGRLVAKELNIPYISSGDIARELHTPLGEMCDEIAMRKQLRSVLTECRDGFVLDGCPRFTEQARWLNSVVGKYNIFCLAVDSCTAISRLRERGRVDDSHDLILKRIANYKNITRPIMTDLAVNDVECEAVVLTVIGNDPHQLAEQIILMMDGE